MWFGWARLGGFVVAVTWNFFLNDRFTFRAERRHPLPVRYALFVGACAFGGLFNWAVSVGLHSQIPFFESFYSLAVLVGAVAGLAFNFTGARCGCSPYNAPRFRRPGHAALSNTRVKGPSFSNVTRIMAPNRPPWTSTPRSARRARSGRPPGCGPSGRPRGSPPPPLH